MKPLTSKATTLVQLILHFHEKIPFEKILHIRKFNSAFIHSFLVLPVLTSSKWRDISVFYYWKVQQQLGSASWQFCPQNEVSIGICCTAYVHIQLHFLQFMSQTYIIAIANVTGSEKRDNFGEAMKISLLVQYVRYSIKLLFPHLFHQESPMSSSSRHFIPTG